MTLVSGEKYGGEFVNGKKHGSGRITSPNGTSYAGEWRGGVHYTCAVSYSKGYEDEGDEEGVDGETITDEAIIFVDNL
jgi:hypothetical protein